MKITTLLLGLFLISPVALAEGEDAEGKKADREGRRAKMIEKFDTNADGKLDKSERAEAGKKMRGKRGKKARRRGMMKRFDANNDGKLDDTEKANMKAAILKRLDTDGDGKLSDAEKKAGRKKCKGKGKKGRKGSGEEGRRGKRGKKSRK